MMVGLLNYIHSIANQHIDSSVELDIPPHMVPPNPDDSDSMLLLLMYSCYMLTCIVITSITLAGSPFIPLRKSHEHQTSCIKTATSV